MKLLAALLLYFFFTLAAINACRDALDFPPDCQSQDCVLRELVMYQI